MKVGLIGRGLVGDAIYRGLHDLGMMVSFYDPKYSESKISDVIDTDCCFIAVPTLPNSRNECDLTIIVSVLDSLKGLNYRGVICIKSTITPGTTQKLIDKYDNDKICFCPEFLKERSAYDDFIRNNPICIVGTNSEYVFNIVKSIHISISTNFKMVKPIEAELTKYMQNVYNTYRILFANGFYEVCKYNDVEYDSVLQSLIFRDELDDKYLKCNESMRGPSGPCLVKDTLAFNEYVKSLNLEVKPTIFQTMVDDMKLYKKTVIGGTRTEIEYFGTTLNP